jgi:hypothetical protein
MPSHDARVLGSKHNGRPSYLFTYRNQLDKYTASNQRSPVNKHKEFKMKQIIASNPSPDARQITVGRNIRRPVQYQHHYIEEVIEAIKFGKFQDIQLWKSIKAIRREKHPVTARNLKQCLPFFTGSYYEGSRSNANVLYAAYAIIDLDHVPDVDAAKNLVMEQLPGALFAFQSVNDGVKIVVSLQPAVVDQDRYRAIYAILQQRVARIIDICPDSTPDWARACFFSYDPFLVFNEYCRGFNSEISLPVLPAKPEPSALSPLNSSLKLPPSVDDFTRAELVIKALSGMWIRYEDWIKTGLALKAAFGERGKALWLLYENNPNYSDDTRELERKWRSFGYTGSVGIGTLFYIGERYGIR